MRWGPILLQILLCVTSFSYVCAKGIESHAFTQLHFIRLIYLLAAGLVC